MLFMDWQSNMAVSRAAEVVGTSFFNTCWNSTPKTLESLKLTNLGRLGFDELYTSKLINRTTNKLGKEIYTGTGELCEIMKKYSPSSESERDLYLS